MEGTLARKQGVGWSSVSRAFKQTVQPLPEIDGPKQDWHGCNLRRKRVIKDEVRKAGVHGRAFRIQSKSNRKP